MARFEDLPADQKAVLQLVLRRGHSYEQIAATLKISAEAVRERAHAALTALGPPATDLDGGQLTTLGDFLLGQQDDSGRLTSYAFLEESPSGRAWAQGVVDELRAPGLCDADALPQIPSDGDPGATPPAATPTSDVVATPVRRTPTTDRPRTGTVTTPPPTALTDQPRVSRAGGMILLGTLAVGIVVVVLVLTGVIGGSDSGGNDTQKVAATTGQTGTTTTPTRIEAQINLAPIRNATKALAVANVVSQGGTRAIAVIGQDLPGGNHYVLWLTKGGTSRFLGFFPAVTNTGKNKGRLQGLVAAPDDLARYDTMLITRETSDQPREPGTIILRGAITQ